MNISQNWLSEYVDVDCPLDELCKKITMAGIEVESLTAAGSVPDGVVTGKILCREKHPDSDHMSVCRVDIGTEQLQIVCGAPNCDAGKTVPVATIGTVFKTPEGDFKIKKSKLRGIESYGMMCSGKEIGVSEDNSGLMIFPDDTPAGVSVGKLCGNDVCIEVEVTPNRPDWLSHYGIARDVACLLGKQAKLPAINVPACQIPPPDGLVTVETPELCPRYIARIIRGVKVLESPEWLKKRLLSVGLRPINNIVDVTNFVLMELGQPMHAFDLNLLKGGKVVVRRAKKNEKITLLDGKTVELSERHLVIADEDKPVALAGIMGGADSCIGEHTCDILLECAVFNTSCIRSTSRELGISSDSSYRYERGVDYDMAAIAADRALQLILETAGGVPACSPAEVNAGRPEEKIIQCRYEKIRSLTGIPVSGLRISEIFKALGLTVSDESDTGCKVTVPLFRLDLSREADLAEEVARIAGLDAIPEVPVKAVVCDSIRNDAYWKLQQLRDRIIDLGFYECMHYSMVSVNSALADSRFEKDDLFKLTNPISQELSVLRPGLLGEMLNSAERNIARRNLSFRLFEVGNVFCKNQKKFPEERQELCLMLSGKRHGELYGDDLKQDYDFFDLKGAVEALLSKLNITRYAFKNKDDSRFEPGMAVELIVEGKPAGMLGLLNRKFSKPWRTVCQVLVAQLDADLLMSCDRGCGYYRPFGAFPATSRDIAFIAPASLSHADITDFIFKAKLQDLESVQLFDVFADDRLKNAGKKSLAYTLSFRNQERTLKDAEINARIDQLRQKMADVLKVELR